MRCAIYARVSTDDKGQDPETQLMPLRAFAEAQGWEITQEYVDRAFATNLKARRAWRELLDSAAKRRVDIVLCWKLDRCFRSVLDASTTLQRLQRWGEDVSIMGSVYDRSPTPALTLVLRASPSKRVLASITISPSNPAPDALLVSDIVRAKSSFEVPFLSINYPPLHNGQHNEHQRKRPE